MLEKLFGWGKKSASRSDEPAIPFGRYSDNNKTLRKIGRWTEAESFFKEKKYDDYLDALFDYMRDDKMDNVIYKRNGDSGEFSIYQGSKIVRGYFSPEHFEAEVTLARMPQSSVPVMRRLLEMNFSLYYSRFALDNERLCMRFNSDMASASPSKLYYSLKELATKGDKQDDLLVQDFTSLETIDTDHLFPLTNEEKETRFTFFQQWIKETIAAIEAVDNEKLSGGIAYSLLSLIYRIDFLIAPEGKVLLDLEKISAIYFSKDEKLITAKNNEMLLAFKKLLLLPKDEVFASLIRSKYTFAIVTPQPHKVIADSIHGANQNLPWYRENNYPFFASQITEYGIGYCQYSYSLPQAITQLLQLFMRINYANYFKALGYKRELFKAASNQFDQREISEEIIHIQQQWKEKFPLMDFKVQNLRYDNLVNFNLSFTNEIELLNMEPR